MPVPKFGSRSSGPAPTSRVLSPVLRRRRRSCCPDRTSRSAPRLPGRAPDRLPASAPLRGGDPAARASSRGDAADMADRADRAAGPPHHASRPCRGFTAPTPRRTSAGRAWGGGAKRHFAPQVGSSATVRPALCAGRRRARWVRDHLDVEDAEEEEEKLRKGLFISPRNKIELLRVV